MRPAILFFLPAFLLSVSVGMPAIASSPIPPGGFYNYAVGLYNSGRFSDATDAFDLAIKKKDHAKEAQDFIDRIRNETVERIRNKALTGVSKANWRTKYYFINSIGNRLRVGVSAQEIFERGSTNFRPGAVDALYQLAGELSKADNAQIDLELISEISTQETAVSNPETTAQQLAAVFSYLSLASRDNLPRY